MTQSHKGYYRR